MDDRRISYMVGVTATLMALIIASSSCSKRDRAPEQASAEAAGADVAPTGADVVEAAKPGESGVEPGESGMDARARTGSDKHSDAFRDAVAGFARQVVEGAASPPCPTVPVALPTESPMWTIEVSVYHRGAAVSTATVERNELCDALRDATRRAVDSAGLANADLGQARLRIDFPDRDYSLIERNGVGRELTHGVLAVRSLTADLLRDNIQRGKEYLFRVFDQQRGGVHKYYYAPEDRFEHRLHTIYTASWIFTLRKLYEIDKDPRIPDAMRRAGEFLLSMQSRKRGDRSFGGFYYSQFLDQEQPEQKLVVGTTSKTIFTLLLLHEFYKDAKYMDAARLAADWLMSMQNQDGSVKPWIKWKGDDWIFTDKQSLLYTGQVLSALSRMYAATKDTKYLDAADLTARFIRDDVAKKGCFLGDEYRRENPISSSWVVLSLFDFYQATGDRDTWTLVNRCADKLLTRQLSNRRDVYRHGRWRRSLSSSGNGWLSEVLSELYLHCRGNDLDDCGRYEHAIVKVTRLLMQYTYNEDSAYMAKNPAAAIGGVFWNADKRYVRTDSVCHAMNAYVNMIGHLTDRRPYVVPERPLADRLTPQE